jgi:hypothetical protein
VDAALSSTIKPSAKQAKIGALLKHGGYTTFWPAFAGLLSLDLTAKEHGMQVLVAAVNASFNGAHQQTVPVKLTKAGTRLLKRVSKLKLRAVWGFRAGVEPVGRAGRAQEVHAQAVTAAPTLGQRRRESRATGSSLDREPDRAALGPPTPPLASIPGDATRPSGAGAMRADYLHPVVRARVSWRVGHR